MNNRYSVPLPFSIQQGGYQNSTSGLYNLLYTFYQENNFLPYWVTRYGPISKAHILLFVLRRVDKEGLDPDRYQIDKITTLLVSRKTRDLAKLDIMLTLALYLYVGDMQEGAVTSCLLDPALFASARSTFVYRPALLRKAVQTPDLQLFLQSLSPRHYQYQALKKMLASYRALAKQGGWPKIPPGQTLRKGMTDPRLRVLAERLFLTGDLKDFAVIPPPPLLAFPKPFPGPLVPVDEQFFLPPAWRVVPPESEFPVYRLQYSSSLLRAVQHFQQRYNLKQDGILGINTLRALNLPIEDHISKIILNMERWRWFPHQLKGRRIIVNIAGFRLIGMKDRQIEITMPVIVGKVKNKTPVFNHFMKIPLFMFCCPS
ncbi:peptidoglycan-binding protein, partial [Desulfobulbus sp. TB]|nr:peptidoglycan-binding protein [Desulfobulbus sp. TB]